MANTQLAGHSSHRAFVRHMADLRTAITDPGGLALELYSKGLIDILARQKINTQSLPQLERSQELVEKMEIKIAEKEEAFDTFLSILDCDPTMEDICRELRATRDELRSAVMIEKTSKKSTRAWLPSCKMTLILPVLIVVIAMPTLWSLWSNTDCYELGFCHSKSLPHVDRFVGREDDIHNITGYLDFTNSDIRVVHIVGPPGFGKSTLAIKIGEIFVRKRVTVHYVDLSSVTDVNTLAEKIMLSIFESISDKVTFSRLQKWVQKQYSNTLLIFDNCDKLFDHPENEFLHDIKSVSTKRNVKYLLTSQYQITDVGHFRLHTIYNLSSEASIELLSKVAPQLTNDQMIEIANLAGNVPLALDIIGAIFNFPEAPTVAKVIQDLNENVVATLSPPELVSRVDVSIGLAYSYLTPELQQLCVNLSHFPDIFTTESAFQIFGYNFKLLHFKRMLDMLVQRSLLHYSRVTERYHFHQLLKTYFHQKSTDMLTQYFNGAFQLYYAQKLADGNVNDYNDLSVLYMETHNFDHMFSLFKTSKDVNITFHAVSFALNATKSNFVVSRLFLSYCSLMLEALDSYTSDEIDSVPSFFEVYTDLVILVAPSFYEETTLKFLESKQKRIDKAYKSKLIQPITYRNFYSTLEQYYKKNGNETEIRMCHTRILETHGELKQCFPNCNYFSLSIAYSNIGDKQQAFHFRELAYEHQLCSLSCMDRVRLVLSLYFDYSNLPVGDNIDKANNLSSMIEEDVYQYLMNASISDYSKYNYEVAIEFFQRKDDKEKANNLEHKMLDADLVGQCDNKRCARNLVDTAQDAFKKQCYYRVIGLANASFQIGHDLEAESSRYIGLALYHLGNYSESQIWLKRALIYANLNLRNEYNNMQYRLIRFNICRHLLKSGDIFNIFCYGYLIKDFITINTMEGIYILIDYNLETEEKILSTETSMSEQKYSYIWSLVDKHIVTRLHMYWFDAINILYEGAREHLFFLKIFTISTWLFLIIPNVCLNSMRVIIFITGEIMSSCCTEKQIQCCFFCFNFCIFTSFVITVTIFLFLLGLDWLY